MPDTGLSAGEASRRIGVAATTIRTWDRRYGLGPSRREPGRHRRYSERDLARLELMRRLTVDGVAPAEAARIAQASGDPTAQVSPDAGPPPGQSSQRPSARAQATAKGLRRAALALDPADVDRLLGLALAGGVVRAWTAVIAPALRDLGRQHSTAVLSLDPVFRRGHGMVYQELARGRVDEEALRDLLARSGPAGGALGQLTPAQADTRPPEPVNLAEHPIRRKQVLGGLTHEYYVAAFPPTAQAQVTNPDRISEPHTVLLVDDYPLVRQGLQAVLSTVDDISVVGEASDSRAAVELAAELEPEVIIMDLQLPGLHGIDATREIVAARPGTAVLVLTMFEDDDMVFSAVSAGAVGYLLKDAAGADIVTAVRAAAGQAVFGAALAQRLRTWFTRGPRKPTQPFPQLTAREREILDAVAADLTNAQIGRQMFLSAKTVANNVANILAKLHLAERGQAIVAARDAGLGRRPHGERESS